MSLKIEVANCLRLMRNLVDEPNKWVKGVNARDKNGRACNSDGLSEEHPVCFCINGAGNYVRVTQDIANNARYKAMRALAKNVPGGNPGFAHLYNDRQDVTHAQMLAWVDDTIAKVESGEINVD